MIDEIALLVELEYCARLPNPDTSAARNLFTSTNKERMPNVYLRIVFRLVPKPAFADLEPLFNPTKDAAAFFTRSASSETLLPARSLTSPAMRWIQATAVSFAAVKAEPIIFPSAEKTEVFLAKNLSTVAQRSSYFACTSSSWAEYWAYCSVSAPETKSSPLSVRICCVAFKSSILRLVWSMSYWRFWYALEECFTPVASILSCFAINLSSSVSAFWISCVVHA